jgi:hypothetical protein
VGVRRNMIKKDSVRLNAEGKAALKWLRWTTRKGVKYNLSAATSKMLIAAAKKRGWRGEECNMLPNK